MRASPELEPSGGPSLWWVWGEIKSEFSELRAQTLANRQVLLDQAASLQRRQDDMRREQLYHIKLLTQRLDGKSQKSSFSWLVHLPWDRIAMLILSALGAVGWIKPQWIRLLTGGP